MLFLEESGSTANEQNMFPAPPKSKSIIYITMLDGLQIIRSKYIYFRKIIYTQRELFFNPSDILLFNHESFYNSQTYVLSYDSKMRKEYHNFHKERMNIVNKFEEEKKIIQYNCYEKVLRNVFIYDIKNVILEFLL